MKQERVCPYNTRLQKGGALLDDMRLLVRTWTDEALGEQRARGISENLLAKRSRARAGDTYLRAFVPRFINGNPPQAWRLVRPLEDRDAPTELVRPIYYWITARSEPLLYDFAIDFLFHKRAGQGSSITTQQAASWISSRLHEFEQEWSPTVTLKVARGVLAALRDFGVLEGRATKRIAGMHIPLESFVFLSFLLHRDASSGVGLIRHADWGLFLMSDYEVERYFMEAHQHRLLEFHAAGTITRIEFPVGTIEEYADVVIKRAH